MVYVDSLTGLANRRYFEAVLKTEIRRAARAGTPLTVALCDIDHFKRFNDTYGHQCGDRVLRLVGKTLIGHCRRPGDVAARYGGEEFALLLPGLQASRTIVVVDKLRQCVAETSALAGIVPDRNPVTISVGYTTFCAGQSASPSKVTHAADIALYRAKNSGRNRIMYEPVHQPDARHRRLLADPSP